jgi:asparagine synthase (glutamine-hydrolysing)
MGLGGAAELYLNAAARDIAPVRLTGNYGSEVLRGVRAFKSQAPGGGFLRTDFDHWVQIAQAAFRDTSQRQPVSFAAFQQASQQDHGRSAIEQSQVALRTPFLHNELLALVYRRPPTLDGFVLAEAAVGSARPSLLAIPTDRGYLGSGGPSTRRVRQAWRQALFKAEYWTNYGMPHWLVRQTGLRRMVGLDRLFLGRHKFNHFRPWLRDRLQLHVRDVLLGDGGAHVTAAVNRARLEQMLDDHYSDRMNYTNEIDLLLTIGLTRKLLFKEPVRSEEAVTEPEPLRG